MKVLAKDLRYRQWFLHDGRKCEAAGMFTKSGECLHLSEGAIAWINENCEVELIDPPEATADCIVVGAGGSRTNAPTYTELQAEWCNDYGIKVGSKVKVTRRAEDGEQGWGAIWMTRMNRYVGSVGTIDEIHQKDGLAIDEWFFPYFVLEPVKEPSYRPYTDAELLEQLGAKVRLKSKDRSHGRLITDVDLGTAVIRLERVSAEALRNKYEHLDGTPCGVKE